MNGKVFVFFIIGFCLGFVIVDILINGLLDEESDQYIITEETDESVSAGKPNLPRILCVVTTSEGNHHLKAIHVHQTWANHCDKLICASGKTDNNLGAINFDVPDEYNYLWGKVKMIMQFVDENFIDDYDWIYKGDDDTFAIIENMRYLLDSFSPNDPIYFGHKFNTSAHKFGYFSGGSGYVLSNRAVRLFVENVLVRRSACKTGKDVAAEDWEMGVCLDQIGVYPIDDRDLVKRKRFLPLPLEHHMSKFLPDWYKQRHFYYEGDDDGLDCCSKYLISSHYVKPRNMYEKYFFTYHLRQFGIQSRFPPLLEKKDFEPVLRNLQQQKDALANVVSG